MTDETNTTTAPAEWSESRLREVERGAEERERARASEIVALAVRHNLRPFGDEHVKAGTPIEQFRGLLLEKIGDKPLAAPPSDIGASSKEKQQYSVLRAARRACADAGHPDFAAYRKSAEFECEVSEAIAANLSARGDFNRRGMLVPHDWFSRPIQSDGGSLFKRDLIAGTASLGGHLVETSVLAAQYIPPAYNQPVVVRAGARVVSGLVGNVSIPRMTAGVAVGWIATEGGAATEQDATFGQLLLQPRDLGVFSDISRRLLQQSTPGVEQLVRDDFAAGLANGIDAAAITGTGATGQPRGILNTSGIGAAAGGTNGLAWSWANVILNAQNVLAANRGDGPLAWVINAQTWGHAVRTPRISAQPVYLLDVDTTRFAGFPYLLSQNMPSNRTKGTGTSLSAAVFGRWSDLIIGEWGVVDMLADPFTASNAGTVRLRAFVTVDVGLRYAASFSTTDDIVTT